MTTRITPWFCRSTNHLWAMDIAKSSHLASNLTFAWRRSTSTSTILRVLGTVIIQSGRLWVVDSCNETDVFDGVPREDEDDDERFGDSIELMGQWWWRWVLFTDSESNTVGSDRLPFLTVVVCQHLLPTLQHPATIWRLLDNAGWTLLPTLMIVVLRTTYFHFFKRNQEFRLPPSRVTCNCTVGESRFDSEIPDQPIFKLSSVGTGLNVLCLARLEAFRLPLLCKNTIVSLIT